MQIVLLERIAKLGQMGDIVKVKDGYARNFLLPQGKALRANKANLAQFEGQRSQLEAQNLERKQEAESVKAKMDGTSVIVIRQSGDTGQLYGSVNTRDIAAALKADGFSLDRNQIILNSPIKTLGIYTLSVNLHPEVTTEISVNVARTVDEAERQARGEDVTAEVQDEPSVELDAVFEEGAAVDLSDNDEGQDASAEDHAAVEAPVSEDNDGSLESQSEEI